MKIDEKKKYQKEYEKQYRKIFYCEICNKEMNIMRKYYHIKNSKEHKKNMEKNLEK